MRQKIRKLLAGALAVAACIGALPGIPVTAEETETAMGRYLESDVALPENVVVNDAVRLEDGSMAIIGMMEDAVMAVYSSADGGASWEPSYTLPEEYAGYYFAEIQLSPKGGGAGIAVESPEEPGADGTAPELTYSLVTFDAQGNVQMTLQDDMLRALQFDRNGNLIGMNYSGGVFLMDPATGEVVREIAQADANMMAVCGQELLLFNDTEVLRYDIETGEPLGRDDALNDAMYGEAQNTAYMQLSTDGYTMAAAQDEEGRLYYCTNEGIYSHMMDGNVVEQVLDGKLATLSSPTSMFAALVVIDRTFYVLCSSGEGGMQMLKYEYAADVSSVPEKELSVYSLTENDTIRQAVVQFQKQYPDTFVNYTAGMSGSDGMTAADALRTLNTDILAGNGPDVLILDDMPIETYREQGILLDLSDTIAEIRDTDGFLENITDAYRTEDGLFAIPTRFSLEIMAGTPELLAGIDGIASLEALASQPDVLTEFDVANLPEILYPVCAGSWKNEDDTIDQEKLSEYVHGIKNIYDAYMGAASAETLEKLESYKTGMYAYWSDLPGIDEDSLIYSLMDMVSGGCKFKMGSLGSMLNYVALTSADSVTGAWSAEHLSMQQSDVFYPSSVIGVLSTANEQERACDFVKYLLSAQCQESGSSAYGFPVNKAAFEKLLATNTLTEGTGVSFSTMGDAGDETYISLDYVWPEQEDLDKLREMVNTLTTCADTERVKKDTVIGEVRRCMNGEITADEAVNSIMQKLNLYLAE